MEENSKLEGKHLSKAGREVLIKSVAQSIPTYCMSSFLLPTTLGDEIQKMLNSFWWGSNRQNGKGINWLRWEKLAVRKEHSGMGFRHLYGFNLAMLRKQGWRLETNQDTIVAQVFKARYFPKGSFVNARLGHNPSFVWRSIHASQVVVRGGLRWRVGNGSKVKVWYDPWLQDEGKGFVTSPIAIGSENLVVSDLIDHNAHVWRTNIINELFNARDAQTIVAMPIIDEVEEDKRIWNFTPHGEYSVSSAYRYIMENLVDNTDLHVEGNWTKL
jgi:hypothetical protein